MASATAPETSSQKAVTAPAKAKSGQPGMVPAELAPLREGDERLTQDELQILSLFEKPMFGGKVPDFVRYSGTICLRQYKQREIVCEQGEAGSSAFYILKTEDIEKLRNHQNQRLKSELTDLESTSQLADAELASQIREQIKENEVELSRIRERIGRLQGSEKDTKVAAKPTKESVQDGRDVLTVMLTPNFKPIQKKKGMLASLWSTITGQGKKSRKAFIPDSIPIDAPTPVMRDANFTAVLHEGQLFGEMSCFNRTPRSATVFANQDCYALEFLRNILDTLHNDETFKKQSDDEYRQRVLQTDVQRIEFFGSAFDKMDPAEFEKIRNRVELVDFSAGNVVMEEGDLSEAVYVVRSGLAKVIKNGRYTLRSSDLNTQHWTALAEELRTHKESTRPLAILAQYLLPAEIWNTDQLKTPVGQTACVDFLNQTILKFEVLNDEKELKLFLKKSDDALKKYNAVYPSSLDDARELLEDAQLGETLRSFPPLTKSWSQYEFRVFGRAFVEALFPRGVPRRIDLYGAPLVLNYLGKGQVIGEAGVLSGTPRGATVIAYDHPDGYNQTIPDTRTGAVASRMELLKLGKDLFNELLTRFPEIKKRFETVVEERTKSTTQQLQRSSATDTTQTHFAEEFEELGLVQGQHLMLIDLDRCTRCGACVEACIDAHDDGLSRLFLDGMRFDKYLVPLTCRSCIDPVCMIGCPVGSIQRGSSLQIEIQNWCIGCDKCAKQCPYGSIQMNPIESIELTQAQQDVLPPGMDLKEVTSRAVVCDLCSSTSGGRPMCVYSCPHDAAHRVSGRELLLDTSYFSSISKN